MNTRLSASLAIDSHDTVGEGPVWDAAQARLLWTDNSSGLIHEARRDGSTGGWRERSWSLGRPIAAAIPRARGGGLIVAAGTEVVLLDEAGKITTFARAAADPQRVKFNDAKCDPRGRLWAGTRDNDFSVQGRKVTPGRGALYRIDPDGSVTKILDDVSLSNGLDWSPDGGTFYYIDTYRRAVDAFDFDMDRGTIQGRRTVVEILPGEGMPDGMTVDREGHLWIALAGAGQVRCHAPDGTLVARVDVPTPSVTSCAFGGADGSELFITTARVRLPAEVVLRGLSHGISIETPPPGSDPLAGSVFSLRPGSSGAPATPFAG